MLHFKSICSNAAQGNGPKVRGRKLASIVSPFKKLQSTFQVRTCLLLNRESSFCCIELLQCNYIDGYSTIRRHMCGIENRWFQRYGTIVNDFSFCHINMYVYSKCSSTSELKRTHKTIFYMSAFRKIPLLNVMLIS